MRVVTPNDFLRFTWEYNNHVVPSNVVDFQLTMFLAMLTRASENAEEK